MTPYQQRQLVLMRQMESSLSRGVTASTIVPMQTDYVNDPQLCLTAVSFVGNDVAVGIYEKIIKTLQTIEPNFYYYNGDSLHLTVQNIRVINNPPHFTWADITKADTAIGAVVRSYEPFSFTLFGILSMPTSISVIALIEPRYDAFVRTLRRQLIVTGVPDDKTYFTDEMVFANITICRYTHTPQQKFLEQLTAYTDMPFGNITANEVSLITTNAGAHPSKTRVFGTYRFQQK
jgi:2'-5' RNA ligase